MTSIPNYAAARIFIDSYDVDVRLAHLGMSRRWLDTAVSQATTAYRFAPPNGLPGNGNYYAADRGLDSLCSDPDDSGWHRNILRRIPVAMNRNLTIAVSVTTGDENTGILTDYDPRTATLKGPATTTAIENSPTLMSTFDDDSFDGTDFYLLLAQWVPEPMYELSQPRIVDNDGHISGWIERIICGPLGGPSPSPRRKPEAPAMPPAQPVVRRRDRAA